MQWKSFVEAAVALSRSWLAPTGPVREPEAQEERAEVEDVER